VFQEENADLRQRLHAVQEQFKGSQAQIDAMDRAATEYRRGLTLLGQERDDLQKQLTNMEHEIGDVLQQLATAQDALEGEEFRVRV
jgi:chromosome segregation ATPase